MITKPTLTKNIDIVTGHQGHSHVTAAQDARRMVGILGPGMYFLNGKDDFDLKVDSATQVTIGTGDAIIQGWHVTVETPVALPIKPCSQGMKRITAICIRVEIGDGASKADKASLVVIDGEETAGTAVHPGVYCKSSFLRGHTVVDAPLWYIPVDGITLGKPERYTDCKKLPTISAIKDEMKSEMLATMNTDVNRIKADVSKAENEVNILNTRFRQLSAVPTVVHSPTTTETIRVGMRYTRPIADYADSMRDTTVDDLGFDFIIEVKKWHTIKKESIFTPSKDAKIINYINLTFKQDPLLEGSDLENREIFPFKIKGSEEQTGIGDAGFRDRIDNALTRVRGLKFTVWLSHPMKDNTYSITGDWGYIDDATYKIRDSHGDDGVKHYKIYGYSGIDCTKYASFIEFGLDSSYVSGFLESRFRIAKYKPATLTIS